MAEQDLLASPPEAPSRPGRAPGAGPVGAFKRLSEGTPLRTKLITAVLVLVIMAILAISIASVYMLRSYVETRQDSTLQNVFAPYANQPTVTDNQGNIQVNLPITRTAN